MSVRLGAQEIVLEARCGVEDVEALLGFLQAHPDLPVELGAADAVHTALWQVLMMIKPRLVGKPAGKFAGDLLLAALYAPYMQTNSG
jgi:hypothetical protein